MKHKRHLDHIIDVHSHPVTPLGVQAPMDQPPVWSMTEALALMDAHHIQACVLSLPNAANISAGPEASDLARRLNEMLAGYVQDRPDRFAALATVPGLNMDGALGEMCYALDTLKLDGVSSSTSINDIYLGDPFYDPWFEEMNRRQATLLCHPIGATASHSVDLGLNQSALEFMFDSTRMLTNLVFTGAKAKYADIKFISTHGGGTIPYLVSRLQTLAQIFGTGGIGNSNPPLSPEKIRAGFATFYYDLTAATSSAQLHALLRLVPASQLLVGFDHPFMPEWSIDPAQFDLENSTELSDEELRSVASDNALTLFPSLRQRIYAS